jgi:hypothetical protein
MIRPTLMRQWVVEAAPELDYLRADVARGETTSSRKYSAFCPFADDLNVCCLSHFA